MSAVKRMLPADDSTNPVEGVVVFKWSKSAWYLAALVTTVGLAPQTISPGSVIVCITLTTLTLCLGHTLGMHRRLIHQSYHCAQWIEYTFVYLGVLVGIAGPIRIIYLHDIRDWAQRHPKCHSFFIHTNRWWIDWIQQLNCEIRLSHPPRFVVEDRVATNRFYALLEKTWMLQQLPLATVLYWFGGIGWVVWGTGVRLFVSLTGHWLVGYLAHNNGGRSWHIEGAAVQGYNVPGFALLTMGESWHNNHHAYPDSARLGLKIGEIDIGWCVLKILQAAGLVWALDTPDTLPPRKERIPLRGSTEPDKRHLTRWTSGDER